MALHRCCVLDLLLVVVVCTLTAGCGRNDRAGEEIFGVITLDDKPLAKGRVAFLPLGVARGETRVADIIDGHFSLKGDKAPTPGKYRVEMYVPSKMTTQYAAPTGARPGSSSEMTAETLPSKFNSNSQMTFEVTPGRNEANFALSKD